MATATPTSTSASATLVTSLVELASTTYLATVTESLVDFTSTAASVVTSSTSTPRDPLLDYLPSYSRSLVVQLIVLSAVATLHIVLILHLAFTTRYHLPLAKLNYVLLTSGVVTSFTAVLWQLIEIAVDARKRAREWPFMFDYLEFVFPASSWSSFKSISWLTVNAIPILLSHVAHIHVLTLLYPSHLEARFILALLVPLALISTAMSFSPLLRSQREQDIFDSGAAVCNSTLTLLYTCALLFWGLYIARQRAWGQSDASGSTAVFGGCAIGMAILGSALSFVGVRRSADLIGGDGGWLTKVTWTVLLWQTWFSVWWWIGAGMYEAEKPLDEDDNDSKPAETASESIKRFVGNSMEGLRRRRNKRRGHDLQAGSTLSETEGEEIEMSSMQARDGRLPPHISEATSSSSSNSTSAPPTFLNTLFRRIRKAHTAAAKRAHRDMLFSAAENPTMNDAIIGTRGNGWSVTGILRSRQDTVAGSAAQTARRHGHASREDRLVGAQQLADGQDGEWQDIRQDIQPEPVITKRFQNWRRKDVTRYD